MTTGAFARSGLGALGLFVALASASHAADTLYHGSLCNPARTDIVVVGYNELGVHNATGSGFVPARSVEVHCGGAITPGSTISQVTVFIFDRNSDMGANVECTLTLGFKPNQAIDVVMTA
jgi:hypothetical protein